MTDRNNAWMYKMVHNHDFDPSCREIPYPGGMGLPQGECMGINTSEPEPNQQSSDSLAGWLYNRYARLVGCDDVWEDLDTDDTSYWEHEAEAVRRAVARRSHVAKLVLVPRPKRKGKSDG